MFGTASKAFFHLLAGTPPLKKFVSRYGMRRRGSFARRFIAGETTVEAIEAATRIEAAGMQITLDHLGESLGSLQQADAATREYIDIIKAIVDSGIGRNISLKLTQLGLDVDRASCVDNLRRVLDKATPAGFFIRLDMEGSKYTEVTLEIFETLWGLGYREMGVVLQSALYRTEEDLPRILRLGARVRLVKGAYKEPKVVAHQKKHDVDEAYARQMKILLASGDYPAFATHDPSMHARALQFAAERGIASDKYEFQLLYGVRRDLQRTLTAGGSRVRIYIPFGREWFPYFMRRLGERPANVRSVVASILDERAGPELMGRLARQGALIAVIALAAVALPILFMAWKTAVDNSRRRQGATAEPFRIAGNFYYVGTEALSVFLLTGPDGHVLLDSGYPPATIAAVTKLGFKIKDVKVLINSEPHDGAQGLAELQQASGAQVWASDANARVIAAGGDDPDFRQPLKTLASLGAMRYTPAHVDHMLKDGETLHVGPVALTAHITSAKSRGCTSWSFPVRDGDRVLNVVSACALTRTGGIRYPEQDADLERSFQLLRSLPVDIWVTGTSRDWGRYRKFAERGTAKDPVKPFIDPGGYRAFIDAAEGKLRNGIFD